MGNTTTNRKKKFGNMLDHLVDLSVENYYNPYKEFQWPDHLSEEGYWMSPGLLSLYGTEFMEELSEEQAWKLSKWEAVNFFSFNVHGIRGLLQHALSCIHKSEFEDISEYLHHFIGEENEHMWFFAQFCNRYGGKIYKLIHLEYDTPEETDVDHFLAFAKMLVSEQIGDYYNVYMKDDATLPPIVQKMNRIHHEDESRHISMGLKIVKTLYAELEEKYPEERLRKIEDYLRRYMVFLLESFYNPQVYRDAGLPNAYDLRRKLLADPARIEFHRKVLRNTSHFLKSTHIFKNEIL